MHQPYYRQPRSDEALLPWVRLHATKDYLHMAQVLARYPGVHATFTMVPSLAEQVQDYASGALHDRLMTLALQSYFSPDDKRYLLNVCFSIQWDNIIRRHPPYAALLDRRHLALMNPDYFSEETYRDLIVWFNLSWTDPNLLETDPLLRRLVAKGRDFSEADAAALMDRHRELIGEVIPTYRRMQELGQLEVVTVPYFHPILPLLIDTDTGRRASPGLPLPEPAFRFASDAVSQIHSAVALHHELLGVVPKGMWPSEGAVSPEAVGLAAAAGVQWLATDEAILGRSLGVYLDRDSGGFIRRPDLLYRPYSIDTEQGEAVMVFRDHELSDRIGFTYQGLGGEQAAEDMIVRLRRIHYQLRRQLRPGLVCIILDGENAWEHYEHNGDVFLNALYRRLQEAPELQAVTVSDYLQAFPPEDVLTDLASGSWIMGDFTTWIGDPEHIEAWQRLQRARAHYQQWLETAPSTEAAAECLSYLHAAEGSDWFWWYSHRNSSDQDALFDQAFIDYLAAAYGVMGQAPPPEDLTPVQGISRVAVPRITFIHPRLNADPDPGAQWALAGVLRPAASTGAMQRAGGMLRAVRYGNDSYYLYLRIELAVPLAGHHIEVRLQAASSSFLASLGRGQSTAFLYRVVDGVHTGLGAITCTLGDSVLELAAPLARPGTPAATFGQRSGLVSALRPGRNPGRANSNRRPAPHPVSNVVAADPRLTLGLPESIMGPLTRV